MKRTYLLAYNLFLAIGWTVFFVRTLVNGFAMDSTSLLLLNICQGAAVLEVVHAGMKWVRSPVFNTFIQVFSRILVVVFINITARQELITILGVSGVMLVTVAWGVTEIIRYSYYAASLGGKEFYPLTFLRYTLFIVLYPLGVTGEWLILLSVMQMNQWALSILNIFVGAVLLSYLPFFPKLYLYMWRQRQKKLG